MTGRLLHFCHAVCGPIASVLLGHVATCRGLQSTATSGVVAQDVLR